MDTSRLSPEKLAWLEEHPEFLKGLEAEIPGQVTRVGKGRDKRKRGKGKRRMELDEAIEKVDEIRRRYDPVLKELEEKYSETLPKIEVEGLVCSLCGDEDHGNKMNGKPWCFKCNAPLASKNQVEKQKGPLIKAIRGIGPRRFHQDLDLGEGE